MVESFGIGAERTGYRPRLGILELDLLQDFGRFVDDNWKFFQNLLFLERFHLGLFIMSWEGLFPFGIHNFPNYDSKNSFLWEIFSKILQPWFLCFFQENHLF